MVNKNECIAIQFSTPFIVGKLIIPTKLQLADNMLFKIFSRNTCEELANLTAVVVFVAAGTYCIETFMLYVLTVC